MNDMILKVTANRLEVQKDTYTTGGSVDYDGCIFEFDSTWDNFIRTAVFEFGNSDFARVTLESDKCKIPAICLQKEGILKIGVYGINDDGVVITTNAVAHRVEEGIGEDNNWYEEDNYFVYNAIKAIEGSLEKYKGELDERFSDLLRKLRESGSVSDRDVLKGEPSEWYSASEFKDSSAIPSSKGNEKYRDFLDYKLNTLVMQFPEYVSYKELGEDSSGDFSLYAYNFEPLDYEKTILITACFHSKEEVAFVALSHFLDDLCRNFSTDRTLAYIRSKVKLVVVPVVNPYGFVNKTDLNANGVDLQRNFPYKWDECFSENKGESVADQSEIYALFDLIETISEDKFCAALNIGADEFYNCGKMVFYPRFKDNCLKAIASVANRSVIGDNDTADKTVFAATINPNIINFLSEQFGVNACSIIWSTVSNSNTNTSVTKLAELIGNTAFTLCENSSHMPKETKLPFVRHISWRSTSDSDVHYIYAADTSRKVPISSYEFNVNRPCCVDVNGYVIVKAANACNLRLNPVLWQDNSPEQTYSERLAMNDFSVNLPLQEGVYVVPLETVLQAYAYDGNTQGGDIYPGKIKFTVATDIDIPSAAMITGFSFSFNVFESDAGKCIEISRPMGAATDYTNQNDVPTQTIIYPEEKVTGSDTQYND